MAGIDLTGDRRSQLLEMLLQQQNQRTSIQSAPELLAKLGAQLIRQKQVKGLQQQEAAAQQQLVDALQAGQATAPTVQTLEDFEGGSGRQQVAIPGKKAVPSEQQAAIAQLPPQQQLQAMQLMAGQRELQEPGFKEKAEIEAKAQSDLQAQRDAAANKRQEKALSASAAESEANRLQRETESLRNVQSRFELARIKEAADKGGVKLTERQGKATSWLNQAKVGNTIIEEKLNAGFKPTPKSVALFSEAIDEQTGNINRQLLRKAGLSQEDINFFDASYLIIDPVVRQSTGAAVKQFEFINWFNALIPQSADPQELEQKSFIRSRLINGFEVEAGEAGKGLLQEIEQENPIPKFNSDTVSINGKNYKVGQTVEAGGRTGVVNADGTITVND